MKLGLVFAGGVPLLLLPGSASAFSFQSPPSAGSGTIDISENVQRDVFGMEDWATQYGVQKSEGLELTSYDGEDWCAVTQTDVPAGECVLFVPSDIVFTASKAAEEFGDYLQEAEYQLATGDSAEKLPLFRIYVKILAEYEKGQDSPWYPWLNSMPRFYTNGAAMTYACYDTLPPYAGWLAMNERIYSVNFQKAAKMVPFLSEGVRNNVNILKWAYCVATTRAMELNGEKVLAPMADMFNHGTETEVEMYLDEGGNVMVYSTCDVPAGSPLRMSLGDPWNPTPIFARYGFMDTSSPAAFCKVFHLKSEMEELGYDFSSLLFYKDTGDISPEVYDVFLYSFLKQTDPGAQEVFYNAVLGGDEDTKAQYHDAYFPYTLEGMRKHVDSTIKELQTLSAKARSYDLKTHPRVPVILEHNDFVEATFQRVKANLDAM